MQHAQQIQLEVGSGARQQPTSTFNHLFMHLFGCFLPFASALAHAEM